MATLEELQEIAREAMELDIEGRYNMTRNDTENLKHGDKFKLISLQGNDAFNGNGYEGETFRVIEHDRIYGTVDCNILSRDDLYIYIFAFRPGFEFELVE